MEEKISRSLFISSADVISMQHVCAFARLVYFLGKAPSSLWGVGWRGGGGEDGVDISMNMLTCLDLAGKARKVKITECVNNFLLITMELNCKS